MRKLDRNSVPPPVCLTPPQCARYSDLHGPQKQEIRSALLAIQGQRCAYCERRTGAAPDDGHIEHFRNQAGNAHLELEWTNMYWSCNDEKTCGKHKDKCDRPAGSGPQATFDPAHLLDPCVDEPSDFIQFLVDGAAQPKPGRDAPSTLRAAETLRVFQLADSPYLRVSREDALKPYVRALDSVSALGADRVRAYIAGEVVATSDAPFSAAIRQFLQGFAP